MRPPTHNLLRNIYFVANNFLLIFSPHLASEFRNQIRVFGGQLKVNNWI